MIRYTLYKVHDISMKFPNPTPNGLAGAAAPHRVELTTAVAHLPGISSNPRFREETYTLRIYYMYIYIYSHIVRMYI